jgi:3-deoxy-D-manno-octulosonate 8-phosphate phosphatase (KDO 8-P phosphatase)
MERTTTPEKSLEFFVFDVDGVFTTGQFIYTAEGKLGKIFGPHDHDGIKKIKPHFEIQIITADKRGFPITEKRIVGDMGLPLELVTEKDRLEWMRENFDLEKTIYMGDGLHDAEIFKHVGYSIAPQNGFYLAKEKADYVTQHAAGEGAVLEACLHVLEKFKS